MRRYVILALIALSCAAASAAPPLPCDGPDEYSAALCSYRQGDLTTAAEAFRTIASRNEPRPETIKAFYFLARTEMKRKRWDEAQSVLIRIYVLDQPFYRAWNCDYLLGLAREGAGKG